MNAYGLVTAPDTVRLERLLPGPIERVWRYLTDADARGSWLAAGPMDLRPGGRVDLVFRNSELTGHDGTPPPKYAAHACDSPLSGRIIACDAPHLLEYTWGESAEPSEVRFELSQVDDGVRLVVTHRRLSSRDAMISVSGGWHAHLDILADRLADRTPAGFWPTHARLEAEYEQRIPQRG